MASVGTVLREARLRQGSDLAAIAEDLRITQRYLECIEKDDFKSLPGVFFYKAFVKQYALRLGLDADSLVREAERLARTERSRGRDGQPRATIGLDGSIRPPAEPEPSGMRGTVSETPQARPEPPAAEAVPDGERRNIRIIGPTLAPRAEAPATPNGG